MRLVCRADASHHLGAGHVMRCLTLATHIRDQGGNALFVTRAHPGHLADVIRARGFECRLWPVKADTILGDDPAADAQATAEAARDFQADWVLVDHYGTDAPWETAQPCPVMAMEDLTTRAHDCAILLNQNLGARARDYTGLVAPGTTCLMGPEFALLRPEFAALRDQALARRGSGPVGRILITMGGTDQPDATGMALDILARLDLPEDLHIDIVMGPTAPHLAQAQTRAAALPCGTRVWAGDADMGALMVQADLAIGAAGSTAWERCALGLPTVMVILADNQRPSARALASAGAALVVDEGQVQDLEVAICHLLDRADLRADIAARAAAICDGRGAEHVLQALRNRGETP